MTARLLVARRLLAAARPGSSRPAVGARAVAPQPSPGRPAPARAPARGVAAKARSSMVGLASGGGRGERRGRFAAGRGRHPFLLSSLQEDLIAEKNAANPVVVYSKTFCPYCTEVKSLFASASVAAKVIELDAIPGGDAVAAALQAVTGRRTVPQVFVGGVHVGGCDDTVAARADGRLAKMLEGAGVSAAGL